MQVDMWVIWCVVFFLCFMSFMFGCGLTFFFFARDKTLQKVKEGDVLIQKEVLNDLAERASKRSKYDKAVVPDD